MLINFVCCFICFVAAICANKDVYIICICMGGQLDGIFLAGSLPHEFIILLMTHCKQKSNRRYPPTDLAKIDIIYSRM